MRRWCSRGARSRRLLGEMSGTAQLVARLLEGLRLRVKDLDFETGEVVVRSGKGNKDRTTMLPRVIIAGVAAAHGAGARAARSRFE